MKDKYISGLETELSDIFDFKFDKYQNPGSCEKNTPDSNKGKKRLAINLPQNLPKIWIIPAYLLPSGNGWRAIGLYDSSTHDIYLADDLSKEQAYHTTKHEIGHHKGMDEFLAENYANAA
ncbi:MAG: hypothetical protein Q8N99_01895 [Nanoarchaeota archaeon]|nr:hypothetical protein [Nanoarchaeota archaeon]